MIDLPPIRYPMVSRVFCKSLATDAGPVEVWVLGRPHPIEPDAKVIRMYLFEENVEVYSVTEDGKSGMRDVIPMHQVKLAQEIMPVEMLSEEMHESQESDEDNGEEEGDEEEGEEEQTDPAATPDLPIAPSNGQAST